VVESLLCPRCSAAVTPDQAFCGRCGAPIAGSASPESGAGVDRAPQGGDGADAASGRPHGKASSGAIEQTTSTDAPPADPDDLEASVGTAEDPRLAALGLIPTAAAAPVFEPEPETAQAGEAEAEADPVADPEPAAEPPARVAGGYVPPARGSEISPWAIQPSSSGSVIHTSGPGLGAARSPMPDRLLRDVEPVEDEGAGGYSTVSAAPQPSPFVASSVPAISAAPARPAFALPFQTAGATAEETAAPTVDSPPEPIVAPKRKESVQELVAFGLIAAGTVVGIASLILPWGNGIDGVGIGLNSSPPKANEWGLSTFAALPLILLSALTLGAAYGSDRAKERLPRLASVIGQATDMIIPMILGGLYLGVVLMSATYPWGFGFGVLVMLIAAGLLIGGAVTTIFFPPKDAPDSE